MYLFPNATMFLEKKLPKLLAHAQNVYHTPQGLQILAGAEEVLLKGYYLPEDVRFRKSHEIPAEKWQSLIDYGYFPKFGKNGKIWINHDIELDPLDAMRHFPTPTEAAKEIVDLPAVLEATAKVHKYMSEWVYTMVNWRNNHLVGCDKYMFVAQETHTAPPADMVFDGSFLEGLIEKKSQFKIGFDGSRVIIEEGGGIFYSLQDKSATYSYPDWTPLWESHKKDIIGKPFMLPSVPKSKKIKKEDPIEIEKGCYLSKKMLEKVKKAVSLIENGVTKTKRSDTSILIEKGKTKILAAQMKVEKEESDYEQENTPAAAG